MSRIGNNPISVPEGVTIDIQPTHIHVKGKLGELTQEYSEVEIKMEENTITVSRSSNVKSVKAKHGLYRALIYNMIVGVTEGFKKQMEVIGVGYRANANGQLLELALGFSHQIIFEIPKILIGYPNYDIKNCILFLINRLSGKGYLIEFIEPFYLYIDWGSKPKTSDNVKLKDNTLFSIQKKHLFNKYPDFFGHLTRSNWFLSKKEKIYGPYHQNGGRGCALPVL